MKTLRTIGLGLAAVVTPSAAVAGTITAQGNVVAIVDRNAFGPVQGTASFDGYPDNTAIPLDAYAGAGMTFQVGSFATIFPGAQGAGDAYQPYAQPPSTLFPAPIGGNGVQQGSVNYFAGVARFSGTVTRVGLTASRNGTQYLTVWNQGGVIIGQVVWTPSSDSAFVGLDTLGVPIGMVSYGNDDVRGGAFYEISGSTIYSDTWIWGNPCLGVVCNDGNPCTDDVCNVADGQCSYPATAGEPSCNDGVSCTEGDVCSNGACAGTPVVCNDGNGCTTEACVEGVGCVPVAVPDGTGCDDGLACTDGETCTAGVCTGSGCDDGNPCTIDACDEQGGCQPSEPADAGAACDDDDVCTVRDACDGAGQCAAGAPLDCDDGNECTLDGCQSLVGCVGVAAPQGTPCTGGTCSDGACVPGGGEGGGGGSAPGTGGEAPGTGGEAPGSGGEGPAGPGATTGSGPDTTTGSGTGGSAATGAGGGSDDGGSETGATDDGCGCEVVGASGPRSSGLLGLVAAAIGAAVARRARRDRR